MELNWDWLNDWRSWAGILGVLIFWQLFYIRQAVQSMDNNLANAINRFSKLLPPDRDDD
jgi:hypothetical protein